MPTYLARGNRAATIFIALLAVASCSLPLKAQSTSIAGVLRNAAGEPVAGGLVKFRSEDLKLGFMVVSQEDGRYNTPNLLPGKYTGQAFGAGYQSSPAAPIDVKSGQQGKVDLILTAPLQIPARQKRMTDADYEKLMPPSEDGIAHIIADRCKSCHGLEPILSARKTPEKWQETLDRMTEKMVDHRRVLSPLGGDDRKLRLAEDPFILKYLSKHFAPNTPQDPRVVQQWLLRPGGPSHPNRNLPVGLLKGEAAKYVAMEFSLPPGSMPRDIAVDSQGSAWVTETNSGMIGRFDPGSLTYTRIASPPGKDAKLRLNAVAVDPDDRVWFADDGPNARILQFDPKSREFKSYPIPEFDYPVPDTGWARIATLRFSDGNVWATGMTSDRILKLDPATREIVVYPVPRGSVPFGAAITADKMIWFAAKIANTVVRLDPSTGLLRPQRALTPRSALRGMAADAEGNVWVAGTESGKLVKADRTGKVTEYNPPSEDSGPFAVDVDTKRNLVWFSEAFSDRLARFDPRNSSFVEFPLPNADSDIRRIEIDRSRPNRIWWSSARADKIGYIEMIE